MSADEVRAQPVLRSSVKGIVLDAQSLEPLAGASILLVNSDPPLACSTDEIGHFGLKGIPIGSAELKVSFIGYATLISDPLVISSGKEADITVYLQQTGINGKEVEVKGVYRKGEALNRMVSVSIRPFSVDETFRFPGTYNDPARMAQNFAGVTSGIDNRNDIIVRGNSPSGVQWRLDDMEIPNPNHFAAVGTTGGPVTMLNDNLLTNSDFLTGSFPAQYGNTTAGVFDLRLKTGNSDHHEFWFGLGWNGLEFGSEGPFSNKSAASYIFSYRVSMLQLLSYTGVKMNVVPQYQDLSFKVNIPLRKTGILTITGMGGLSYIQLFDSRKEQSGWMFPDYGENLANGSNLAVLGLTHQAALKPGLRMKTMLYAVSSLVYTSIDTFSNVVTTPSLWAGERSSEVKLSFSSRVYKKFSTKSSMESGLSYDHFFMQFSDSMMFKSSFQVHTGTKEQMDFVRVYGQWLQSLAPSVDLKAGIYGSWLLLNNSWSAEPRIGLDWRISDKHTLNFGAGLYSQMPPHVIYFQINRLPGGAMIQPNRNLDFIRSVQSALSYDFRPTKILHLKTEVYYQYLYDLPVKSSIPQYSLINEGHDFFLNRQYSDSLINKGTGSNYGIEFTFERYYNKQYYFLFTASVYQSTYTAYDNVRRNSAFGVNYVLNAVGGYDFVIGKRRWGILSLGLRATYAGGNPYIPFDVNATVASGETMMDWPASFTVRYPDYKRASLRFGLKRNLPGYNIEFILDLQYRTNYTNVYLQRIDPKTGEIRNFFNMGFFPMATWRIQF
ncbi:MAG: TonB-dependent receptor [Bacteroidetes bacterium]|nr:TonB-dependent receptor [Bacteroidota bacterium]